MYKKGGGLFDFLGRPSSEVKRLNDRINKLLINIDYSEGKYTSNKSLENLIKWLTNLHELDTIINNPNINKNSAGTKVILDKIKVRNNKMGEILINAAKSNNEEHMGLILAELPMLVNYTGRNKVTALHIVARLGNSKFINVLLDSGADINAKMVGNLTPLHQAVISGDKKSIKALIDAGANNSVVNERGHTARNLAQHGTVYNSVPSNFKKIRPLNTRRLPRAGINENLNNRNPAVNSRTGSSKRPRAYSGVFNSKRARVNNGQTGLRSGQNRVNNFTRRTLEALGIQQGTTTILSNEELDAELARMAESAESNTRTSRGLSNEEQRWVNAESANLERYGKIANEKKKAQARAMSTPRRILPPNLNNL